MDQIWAYFAKYKDGISVAVEAGTLVVSALTLFVAVIGGLRSVISLAKDKRNERMAQFIALFSDENEIKRLSGINGIKRYAGALFKELFFICSVESSDIIRRLIDEALMGASRKNIKDCVSLNTFVVDYLLLNEMDDDALNVLKGDLNVITPLKYARTNTRIGLELKNSQLASGLAQSDAIVRHIQLSSDLLANAMKHSRKRTLTGNLVNQSNLYRSSWKYNSLLNSVLRGCVARHMNIKKTEFVYCSILSDNFFDSKFQGDLFKKCKIRDCSFNQTNLRNSRFEEGELYSVKFNGSALRECVFQNIQSVKNCMWNGSDIDGCGFDDLKMPKNEFSGIQCRDTRFSNVELWKSKISGNFFGCSFSEMKLGGASIKGTGFENCRFINVDFRGASLSRVTFKNCHFDGCNLDAAKQEDLQIVGCTGLRLPTTV